MYYPSLEKVKSMLDLEAYGVIPIRLELISDQITPMEVLKRLKNVSEHCYMLESADGDKKWGRYTYLGYDPILEVTCKQHELVIKSGMTIRRKVKHPGEYIRDILKEYRSVFFDDMPSFTGGFVGYFSYDYIRYAEPVLDIGNSEKKSHFNDVDLMLFDKVIAFDHYKQKVILIVNMKTDAIDVNYEKATFMLQEMKRLIFQGQKKQPCALTLNTPLISLYKEAEFIRMVEKAKAYIREGDIFQVVLSNQMTADVTGSLFDTYRLLRTTNPSPYMFYFSSKDIEMAGASPETLIKLENNWLYTFPLAGTKPRGKNEQEDEKFKQQLLEDDKELAEHNMLVDLGRNDIGRISEIGSVQITDYKKVLPFSHVMHLGSTVKGKIRKDKDPVDAIDAILPAGTLSGAPKIRACQIIEELEVVPRGIYGGAIGYIDFRGNVDTCIAIRLAYQKEGKLYIRSGAGIVKDSVPKQEYQECVNKAKAMVQAVLHSKEETNDFID